MAWEHVLRAIHNRAKDHLYDDWADAGQYAHSADTIVQLVRSHLAAAIVGGCPTLDQLTARVDDASHLIGATVGEVADELSGWWSTEPARIDRQIWEWVQ